MIPLTTEDILLLLSEVVKMPDARNLISEFLAWMFMIPSCALGAILLGWETNLVISAQKQLLNFYVYPTTSKCCHP